MPRIKTVDVNVGAFKSYKTIEELKAEPGRIFEHLGHADQDAGYAELFSLVNPPQLKQAVVKETKP